jgi:Ca2+-binding RTX toxin-like protein
MYMPLLAGRLAALFALLLAIAPGTAGAAPACGEPPETVGTTIVGTPCADTIHAPRGITAVHGEGGDDALFGGRGNERLFGGEGHDRLYGGIGDDQLRGGNGDDRLSGGFGADSVLDGEAGNDFVRGDATIDHIQNSGGGVDTLSYATGVTPGFFDRPGSPHFFPDFSAYADFPAAPAGRGAFIDLPGGRVDNGRAPDGGGFDEDVEAAEFEVVVGSAFADYIVGTSAAQTIYGGGGPDVILGEGGGDQVFGGEEGDYCATTGATVSSCEHSGTDRQVDPRSPSTIGVGVMAPGSGPPAVYLTGTDGGDAIVATYSGPPQSPGAPTVALASNGSPVATFPLSEPPNSVLLAGLGGEDSLSAVGFPATTSIVLLGGEGNDTMTGGDTEDALVDGPGNDVTGAGAGDDAVPNNEGDDDLDAGTGDDLFVSDAVCNGDSLDGGLGRDNANWAQFKDAVTIDMRAKAAGLVGAGGQAQCPSPALLTQLAGLEDIEGTSLDDFMIGDDFDNQLLGRLGHDTYFAEAGNDLILANSGTPVDDPDLTIDCGGGFDTALVDHPENGPDPAPVGCESIEARNPNSFRPPDTPLDPDPPPERPAEDGLTEPPPPPQEPRRPRGERPDRTPPQTALLRRPGRLLLSSAALRRVVFAFRSNEQGAGFRCRLDRRPFRPCRSPRAYRVRPGRHAFRVFAIDAAGNRDRTPAAFAFAFRRR